jgi:hypothetical protein
VRKKVAAIAYIKEGKVKRKEGKKRKKEKTDKRS